MTTYQKGFSLVQIIIALTVVLVFFTDIPKGLNIVSNIRARVEADKFANAVWFAKTEAEDRRTHITLCKSPDSLQCSAQSHWNEGWMVFVDQSHDARFDPVKDHVLRTHKGGPSDLNMVGHGIFKNHVSFSPDGSLFNPTKRSTVGFVSVCVADKLDNNSRAIKLSGSGKVSVVSAMDLKGAKC